MSVRLGFSVSNVLSSPAIERLFVENSYLQIGNHISHLVKNKPQIIREFEPTIKAVPFSIAIMHFLIQQY